MLREEEDRKAARRRLRGESEAMSSRAERSALRERVYEIAAVVRELTRGRTPLRMSAEEMALDEMARVLQRVVDANAKDVGRVRSALASVQAALARRSAQ